MTQVKSKTDLVVLAGGRATRLWPLTHDTPKALLSVAGKPLLYHIISAVSHLDIDKVIVVCAPGNRDRIKLAVEHSYDIARYDFHFVVQEDSLGPGDAVDTVSPYLSENSVLLWLSDTLGKAPSLGDTNFVVVSPVDDPTRWCVASIKDGNVQALHDKPEHSDLDMALIGQYFFTDGRELQKAINKGRQVWKSSDRKEFEISHILNEFIVRGELGSQVTQHWKDAGTMESYSACKQWIPERSFNSIEVDSSALLTKTSDSANIIEEMLWYRTIPEASKILAPRLLREDVADYTYHIEFLNYKTLSEVFIFDKIHSETWEFIIGRFLDLMYQSFWVHTVNVIDMPKRTRKIYRRKTFKRVEEYIDTIGIDPTKPLTLNGVTGHSFNEILEKIDGGIDQLCEGSNKYASIIHGDLVFSNVLCSFPMPIFRVIDPRGTFGKIGPFGDYRYELAKLRQCYDGMYDAIIHDLFDLEQKGTNSLTLRLYPDRTDIGAEFDRQITSKMDVDLNEIMLIQGLLFLSLIPMHDDKLRQLAYLVQGCSVIEQYLQSTECSSSDRLCKMSETLG